MNRADGFLDTIMDPTLLFNEVCVKENADAEFDRSAEQLNSVMAAFVNFIFVLDGNLLLAKCSSSPGDNGNYDIKGSKIWKSSSLTCSAERALLGTRCLALLPAKICR